MTADKPVADESYLFGDTDLAAERLRVLAEVFAPSTRDFLRPLAQNCPRRVLDLGCGPGYTTRLLADVFQQAHVVGVDSSAHFMELARRTPAERVEFLTADVTRALPAGPYDLIYARHLLTHIARASEAIELWGTYLSDGGLMAIEENECTAIAS